MKTVCSPPLKRDENNLVEDGWINSPYWFCLDFLEDFFVLPEKVERFSVEASRSPLPGSYRVLVRFDDRYPQWRRNLKDVYRSFYCQSRLIALLRELGVGQEWTRVYFRVLYE